MREIRFRAWDACNKRFVFFGELNTTNKGEDICVLEATKKIDDFAHHSQSRDLPLMQFTGLQDKNGKDIYEGDILESGLDVNYLVSFEDGAFKIIHPPTCRAEEEGECKRDYLEKDCIFLLELSVVGNIYQDKNLLEDENNGK